MRGVTIARGVIAVALGLGPGTAARAQGLGGGPAAGYGISPMMPSSGGGASYLPYGVGAGGFVPYSPGPGVGVGVQTPAVAHGLARPEGGMGMAGAGAAGLGRVRSAIAPFGLIRRLGTGTGGMGGSGPLILRSAPGAGMGGMARPPVGGYPFRQPPSLLGPASTAPAMSM